MERTIKISEQMLDVVLQSLAAQPYGRVAAVIDTITRQVMPLENTASDVMENSRANGSAQKEIN